MVQIVLLVLIPALAWGCSVEQLVVAAVWGVVQQEEAEVKYQSGFTAVVSSGPTDSRWPCDLWYGISGAHQNTSARKRARTRLSLAHMSSPLA